MAGMAKGLARNTAEGMDSQGARGSNTTTCFLFFEWPVATPRRIFRETARFKVRPPRDFHPRRERGTLNDDMRLSTRNLQPVPSDGRHRSAAP